MGLTELPFDFVTGDEFASQGELDRFIYKFSNVSHAETFDDNNNPFEDKNICFVKTTETWYYYLTSGSSFVRDGNVILNTSNGGNTRWIAYAGRYSALGISFGSGTLISKDGTGQITLEDSTTGQKTLQELSLSGSDERVKVSSNDTTIGYLIAKLIGILNKVELSEVNDGSNETLQINVRNDISQWNANKIKGKLFDDTDLDDDWIIRYDLASSSWKVENQPNKHFGVDFNYDSDESTSETTSTEWQTKVTMNLSDLEEGNYIIKWYYEWQMQSSSANFESKVELNNSEILGDAAEQAVSSDSWSPVSGFKSVSLTSGSHTIDFEFKSGQVGKTAKMRRARVMFWRIN